MGRFNSPEEYVDYMLETATWRAKAKTVREVRFMACNTGTGDWAQRAANRIKEKTGRTDVIVTAPDGFITWTISPDDYLIGYRFKYTGALGFEKSTDIITDSTARLTPFRPQ
jgi:hypothetical protein